MSRVLLLDLGDTLIHGNSVLPHVRDALTALAEFRDDHRRRLPLALVSDTEIPAPPRTPAKIRPIFDEYVAVLDGLDLRSFFEPVSRHVTLSAHAGVRKPDRRVFETALHRLRVTANVDDCVFVTENAEHVGHCRDALGMKALQFGRDFTDWSTGPLRIAQLIADTDVNLVAALQPWAAAQGIEDVTLVEDGGGRSKAQGQMLVPLSGADLAEAEGAHVRLPVTIDLVRDPQGRLTPRVTKPAADDVSEATSYLRGLVARGEIGTEAGPLTTHTLETDSRGRRVLKRRGFKSAV